MKKLGLLILAFCLSTVLYAQTYSGIVLEQEGGKPIAGVNVSLVTLNGLLITWDYYSLPDNDFPQLRVCL